MYTICCDGWKLLQSIEGAVSLKIMRINAAKKVYSFNDLRDLESKLVLIRGRGTKGGAEIDRFLDVSAVLRLYRYRYDIGIGTNIHNIGIGVCMHIQIPIYI